MNYPNFVIFLIFFSFLISCSDDNTEIKDKKSPTVTFLQDGNTPLTGLVKLEFNLVDDKQLTHMQVLIDGNLIADQALSLQEETVSIEWDSKSLDDGIHQIKVVATDNSGNSAQPTFDIVVKNTLTTISIAENYLSEGQDMWIFLSDNAGNSLGVQQVHNNTILKFPVINGFKDETFIINIFTRFDKYRDIASFANMKSDEYFIGNGFQSEPVNDRGIVTITVYDSPSASSWSITGPDVLYSDLTVTNESIYTFKAHIAKDDGELLLNINSKYYFNESVKPGDNIIVSFNELSDLNYNSLLTEGVEQAFIFQMGYRPNATLRGEGHIYNFAFLSQVDEIKSFYLSPGIFNFYVSTVMASYGNTSYTYRVNGSYTPTTFKKSTVEILSYDISENKIQMKLSEQGQLAYLGYTVITESIRDQWYFFMPHQLAIDYKRPQIPGEIIDLYYPDGFVNYPFTGIVLEKSLNNRTYEDYLNEATYFSQSSNLIPATDEILTKQISFSSETGRSQYSNISFTPFIPKHEKFANAMMIAKMKAAGMHE